MRLVDADTLIKELHEAICTDVDFRKDYELMGIDEFIKNQPIAYDVDKVVEQLASIKTDCEKMTKHKFNLRWKRAIFVIKKAIKVVKGGGVDE